MAQFLINNVVLIVAALIGLSLWQGLNLFLKIIVCQLCISILNEFAGTIVITHFHWKNNYPLYNLYILIEAILLLGCLGLRFKHSKRHLLLLSLSLSAFLAFWLVAIIRDFGAFANYAAICENILLLIWYLHVLYESVITDGAKLKNHMLWLCFGIIIYAGSLIPYLCLMYYANDNYPALNKTLGNIIIVLENTRYLSTAIALFLYRRSSLPYHQQSHGRI